MHYAIPSSESKPGPWKIGLEASKRASHTMPEAALCPESASSPRIFDPEGLFFKQGGLLSKFKKGKNAMTN